jgi:membrane-bound serine protease (ClpP class)
MCFRPITASLLGLAVLAGPGPVSAQQPAGEGSDRPVVLQIRLANEAITPVAARFIERSVRQAEREGAACLVIVLDTPGGLVDSTRNVVQSILRSGVPVVVYVAPPGARAASAGVFIVQAGHVAAMAPGTNIGAAHPVQIGGLPGSPPEEKKGDARTPAEEKAVNDTVAWARALAELRGRNAEWAARAVRESVSVPASEAAREKAIDLVADDLDGLLARIDGREVSLPSGPVRLRTAGAEVRTVEMWWGDRVLSALSNPTLAFLLLMIGFYGILFELYTPGWGVAGTLGVVSLVLAFFGLAVLPVNSAGLALIAVALALFVAEVFVTGYGALTVGGLVCLVLGGTMLVDSPAGFQGVSLRVLLPVAAATAAITFFLVGSIVRAHRGRVQTGAEALVGAEAVAETDFALEGGQYAGTVRAHGELWKAVSPEPVAARQPLAVRGRDGLTLLVEPAAGPGHPESHHDAR